MFLIFEMQDVYVMKKFWTIILILLKIWIPWWNILLAFIAITLLKYLIHTTKCCLLIILLKYHLMPLPSLSRQCDTLVPSWENIIMKVGDFEDYIISFNLVSCTQIIRSTMLSMENLSYNCQIALRKNITIPINFSCVCFSIKVI
jgi:hypothetical protein